MVLIIFHAERKVMASESKKIKKIAINTGGGDAPGLNAVIKAVTVAALNRGWEVVGIRDGYNGLFLPENYPNGDGLINLTYEAVEDITPRGGTILGTTNRGNPTRYPMKDTKGNIVEIDRTDEVLAGFRREKIDALVAIGGDGSLMMANGFVKKGLRVVGVPKTIDNDLDGTVSTFGFDTAVSYATEAIDRLHTTAMSHRRIMIVELMGRYAGHIALEAGISSSADVIIIPEIPYDINIVADHLNTHFAKGRKHAIVVVAEGAKPKGGDTAVIEREAGKAERLGGAAERVQAALKPLVENEIRTVILGHLLRGGSPSSADRMLSLRFGAAAIRALDEGMNSIMVALDPPNVRYVPLDEISGKVRMVDLESDIMTTGRDLGICFGD